MHNTWKKRVLIGAVVLSMLPVNSIVSLADAAPDGMTVASDTEAGKKDGAWDKWVKEWETIKDDWTQISLTPGKDESQLNFAWYTAKDSSSRLKISTSEDMKNASVYVAKREKASVTVDGKQYYSNKVTALNLKSNTTYYYTYEVDGVFTEPAEYTTKATDNFSFIFVGDPQIGSSNEKKSSSKDVNTAEKLAEFIQAQSEAVRNDSFNWADTLNKAMTKTNNQASFIVSAGDQIQLRKSKSPQGKNYESEIEYTGYLSPEVLTSLPIAPTIGNHDADNANYTYHFNVPNKSEYGVNTSTTDTTKVGGDYYFTYGSVLFMMLNTQDTNVAEHKNFIEETVKANKDCTWRIVTLHQDIYGSAEHSNEPEITNLRYQLVPILEANDIDVVLTGHDHAYSRTQILKGGVKTFDASYDDDAFSEQLEIDMDAGKNPKTLTIAPANITSSKATEDGLKYLDYLNKIMDATAVEKVNKVNATTVLNPEGILYMTGSSSSGSKYYDLVARQQTYIASRWQEDVPTYSVIDITPTSFTINTYRTDNNKAIDES
ncbi:metallophosphoesterase family protein, partial [Anaerosporobacter sp.]|uniref:metallophosphoesterase family protein n=1 Tax=Anaerosporobacter sp. TaxID=1872529 RepID=UPI00286F257D